MCTVVSLTCAEERGRFSRPSHSPTHHILPVVISTYFHYIYSSSYPNMKTYGLTCNSKSYICSLLSSPFQSHFPTPDAESWQTQLEPMHLDNPTIHQRWNWLTFCDPATQWPSDQRPGDPVDPVTLFYNELQMLTYAWRSILRRKKF